MSVFYLLSIILGVTFQQVVRKPYTQKSGGKGVFFYSFMVSLAAMVFFIVSAGGFEWNVGIVPYSVCFALSYAVSTVFGVAAVYCGSLSLTSLITSYSLLMPTIYGLVFLHDPIGIGLFPGLILLGVSLFLINKKSPGATISLKWLVYVFIAFAGNGLCSIFQKAQQVAFDGAYKNEFMIVSLAIVVLLMAVLVGVKERKNIKTSVSAGWYLAILAGIVNGIVNLFVMILSGIIPVSIMFPLISAGGIILTYLISKFCYKEELTKAQFAGFIIGIVSVVFLNI